MSAESPPDQRSCRIGNNEDRKGRYDNDFREDQDAQDCGEEDVRGPSELPSFVFAFMSTEEKTEEPVVEARCPWMEEPCDVGQTKRKRQGDQNHQRGVPR